MAKATAFSWIQLNLAMNKNILLPVLLIATAFFLALFTFPKITLAACNDGICNIDDCQPLIVLGTVMEFHGIAVLLKIVVVPVALPVQLIIAAGMA